MILLNFSHPLTEAQLAQVEALVGKPVARLVEVSSQIDPQQPLDAQVRQMVEATGLDSAAWQQAEVLVNPPALNFSAVLLLAELHGRMGYFPPCLRLRPVPDALPPRWEVAELLNLQQVREQARQQR